MAGDTLARELRQVGEGTFGLAGGGMAALSLGLGSVLIAAATWALFAGNARLAGALAATSGALLVVGGMLARRDGGPLWSFLDAVVSLAFDGCLLAAIALALRSADPPASAAAAAALVLSFLAAYVRARGQALRYPVEESLATRAVRYALISFGLVVGPLAVAMFALLGLTALLAAVRASQVAKQERE